MCLVFFFSLSLVQDFRLTPAVRHGAVAIKTVVLPDFSFGTEDYPHFTQTPCLLWHVNGSQDYHGTSLLTVFVRCAVLPTLIRKVANTAE